MAASAADLPVETVGISSARSPSFPHPALADVLLRRVRTRQSGVHDRAVLGAIESLLSATIADGMTGTKHDPDAELVALGVGNIVAPFFGGIPATGALARTATNIRSGGRTPISAVVHSAVVLLSVLAPCAARGLRADGRARGAALAGRVEHGRSTQLRRIALSRRRATSPCSSSATFSPSSSTWWVAVSVGVLLAAFLFIRRMAELTNISIVSGGVDDDLSLEPAEWRRQIPVGVSVFEINGPFFFGAVETFRETLDGIGERPRVLVIRMRGVHALDSTGMHALRDVVRRSRRGGAAVILSDVQPQPRAVLEAAGSLSEIGGANIAVDIDDALARAYELNVRSAG